jgi:hypothetical protein
MTMGWPGAFSLLQRELRASRGTVAVFEESAPESAHLKYYLSAVVDRVFSLGQSVTSRTTAPTDSQLFPAFVGQSVLLTDIDILFSPQLQLAPLTQIRQLAHGAVLIVSWPGRIVGGRLSFSLPGRIDHMDELARDMIVLRPAKTDFPDETPYTMERYPS